MRHNEIFYSLLKPVAISNDFSTALDGRTLRSIKNEDRNDGEGCEQGEFEEKGSEFRFWSCAGVVDMKNRLNGKKPQA